MLHPSNPEKKNPSKKNPSNPETPSPRYKFKRARSGEAHRAEAAACHQGRSQRMSGKIRGFIRLWVPGVYPKHSRIDELPLRYPRIGKPPEFFPHALGPTRMARGSCEAKAPPPPRAQSKFNLNLNREILRNPSFSMWWILGV